MEKGTGLTSVCLAWAELTFWQLKTLYSVQKSGYICALPGHYCKWSKMLCVCSSSNRSNTGFCKLVGEDREWVSGTAFRAGQRLDLNSKGSY